MADKLIYVANIRLPTEKAHGLATIKMCEAFANEGMSVALVAPKRRNPLTTDPFAFYGMRPGSFEIRKTFCMDLVSLGKAGFYIQWLSFSLAAFARLLADDAKYYYGRDELSLWLLSFFKKNVAWEAHVAKDNWLVRNLMKRAKTVAISHGLKKHYLSLGGEEEMIAVAPSGVDVSAFQAITESKEDVRRRLALPLDKQLVVYIGKRQTMGRRKGVEELEEAFRELSARNADIELLIVDHASAPELPYYMKAADILIMNYPDEIHYSQFMSPLKVFEYMASGVPIVAPNLPSIREILDDSMASFFPPNDAKSMVSLVENLVREESYRAASEKAGRASLEAARYDWNIRAKNILKFI